MTQLYIPSVGDEIRLTEDWHFGLINEDRNSSLMEFTKDPREVEWQSQKQTSCPCMIPAGEVLKIDRIYIRKGKEEYDSITFMWKNKRTQRREKERTITSWPNGFGGPTSSTVVIDKIPARPIRFWVKLDDANKIVFEPVC